MTTFDFETTDQNRYSCGIVLLCVKQGRKMHTFSKFDATEKKAIAKIMATTDPKVAHNMNFDLYLMENRLGIPVRGEVHDTYLMAKHWHNDFPAYDLKSLSWWLFGDTYAPLTKLRAWIHKANQKGEDDLEFDMSQCPLSLVVPYCQHDVRATEALATHLLPLVQDNYAYQLDCQAIRLVSKMEDKGIKADILFYENFIRLGRRRVRYNLKGAKEDMGVEGKPTGKALREHLRRLGEDRLTPSGMVRSDDVVLRDHKKDAGVRHVGKIRTDQKLVSTYAENILASCNKQGIFHPHVMQSSAITRRFRARGFYSDMGPIVRGNIQNPPRGPGIRTGITVPDGYKFCKRDLASIEARLAAHAMATFIGYNFYCEEYKKNDKFNIYLWVVENCTSHGKVTKKDPIYTAYKHACLGIQYGVGVKTFYKTMVETFQLPYSITQCEDIYNTVRRRCPEFTRLQRALGHLVEVEGKLVDDMGGVYYIPKGEEYKAVNYYCQGLAGNILKWWWVETDKLMEGTKDYTFNTLHDEFDDAIWNDAEAEERVRSYCDVLKGLDVFELPIVAESSGLVNNWAEAG